MNDFEVLPKVEILLDYEDAMSLTDKILEELNALNSIGKEDIAGLLAGFLYKAYITEDELLPQIVTRVNDTCNQYKNTVIKLSHGLASANRTIKEMQVTREIYQKVLLKQEDTINILSDRVDKLHRKNSKFRRLVRKLRISNKKLAEQNNNLLF